MLSQCTLKRWAKETAYLGNDPRPSGVRPFPNPPNDYDRLEEIRRNLGTFGGNRRGHLLGGIGLLSL